MSDNTHIEWTDATWNPLRGCSRVSAGCQHCYAETVAGRFCGAGQPYEGLIHPTTRGWNGKIKLIPEALQIPYRWARPRRIFVNSMSDLFHPDVPFEFIAAVFWIMSVTTRHTYQVLTKRPERMLDFFRWLLDYGDEDGLAAYLWQLQHEDAGMQLAGNLYDAAHTIPELAALPWTPHSHAKNRGGYDNCGPGWPLKNVWLGVSVENQATADERIPLLLQCPAAVRWISAEPLLGPIDLTRVTYPGKAEWDDRTINVFNPGKFWVKHRDLTHESESSLDWVVAGGESGTGARPMSIQWARELRDQCAAAGVPFLFKQWGAWKPAGLQRAEAPGKFAFGDYQHNRTLMVQCDSYPRMFTMFGARSVMERVGKKAAGRQLDGVQHDGYPEAA